MSPDLEQFIRAATSVGLARRLSALAHEVDQAIAAYPSNAGPRYLKRLDEQRRRLTAPDLELIGAVAAELCERDLTARTLLVPLAERLAPTHPQLRRLVARPPAAAPPEHDGATSARG